MHGGENSIRYKPNTYPYFLLGILNKMKFDVMHPAPFVPLPTVRRDEPLSLTQTAPAIIILAAGLVFAGLAFLREIVGSTRSSRRGRMLEGMMD